MSDFPDPFEVDEIDDPRYPWKALFAPLHMSGIPDPEIVRRLIEQGFLTVRPSDD